MTSQKIEVVGVRGMKSKPFRKTFRNEHDMDRWMDENGGDITVTGVRDLEQGE